MSLLKGDEEEQDGDEKDSIKQNDRHDAAIDLTLVKDINEKTENEVVDVDASAEDESKNEDEIAKNSAADDIDEKKELLPENKVVNKNLLVTDDENLMLRGGKRRGAGDDDKKVRAMFNVLAAAVNAQPSFANKAL